MNRLMIIGNLTRDPEVRSTQDGTIVCGFTVAVNRKRKPDGTQETDFFNVSAWRQLGESCGKYLAKGRKVCVIGPVGLRTFQRSDGSSGASMEIIAQDVEFLSPRDDAASREENSQVQATKKVEQEQMVPVDPGDDLPF